MAASVQKNQQSTISQRTHPDGGLGAVDEEVVTVETCPSGGELVPLALIDEVYGENGLQNILRRHLTLLKTLAVLLNTFFTGDVCLRYSSAENGNNLVWALCRQLVGDQLVQPSSRDSVVFEGGGLKQLN